MLNRFRRKLSLLTRSANDPDSVVFQGLTLPAPNLRTGGPAFRQDEYYVASAQGEANRLIQHFGLTATTPLLDVGSGLGRLATGLLGTLGEIAHYRGIDVDARRVAWCTRHIAQAHSGYEFAHINVANERYNPEGVRLTREFQLPFAAGEFQVIYLYSVFSHMLTADVQLYLAEFARLLGEGGRVFLTAFVEQDVADVVVNPPGYIQAAWRGALHCVRYSQAYFEAFVLQAGFQIDAFEHGQETNGQSGYYLSKAAAQSPT